MVELSLLNCGQKHAPLHRCFACLAPPFRSHVESREPASVEICTLLRKPDAAKVEIDCKYVGFEIPDEFVVGYGIDYAQRNRNLGFIGKVRFTG